MDEPNSCFPELIETRNYLSPNYIDEDGDNGLTLLCKNKSENIALELFKVSQYKPDHINKDGNTALIWVCSNKL